MIISTNNLLLLLVFLFVSINFLFPLNRIVPFDRRVIVLFGSALCYIIKACNHTTNLLQYIDVSVLVILASIMVVNHIVMKQTITMTMISYLQNQIKCNKTKGFWFVSIVSFVLSPLLTNDGLCLILTNVVLDAFISDDTNDNNDSDDTNHDNELINDQVDENVSKNDCLYFSIIICTSANLGSTILYTGNPQNMIVYGQANFLIRSSSFMLLQFLPSLVNWLITTTFLNYCRTSKPGSFFYIRTNNSGVIHSKINQNEEVLGTDNNQIKVLNKSITFKDVVPWLFLFVLVVLELSNMVSLVSLFSLTAIFCMIIVLLLEYYFYNDKGPDAMLMIEEYTESIFKSIDFNLLIIFCGLFICSGTLVETKLPEVFFLYITGSEPFTTSLSTFAASIYIVIMSQFVGNVPLVIMMINPINNIKDLALRKHSWLLLSYISTVAGNLTISGSAANVIVVEIANRHRLKVKIDAIFHLKVCFVITIFNILLGSFIISLESKLF